MGAISFSIDRGCVELLASRLGFCRFVETGTFKGDSIARVRDLFPRVVSVEIDPGLAQAAAARFADDPGVDIRQGSSPDVLRSLSSSAEAGPTLWWLDAHWCESAASGPCGQCPLLDELEALPDVGERDALAIDDARLFLAPPTAEHRIADWPTFDAILARLRILAPKHRIAVLNDVIWILPAAVHDGFLDHAARTAVDWLAMAEKSRTYDAVLAQLGDKDAEIRHLTEEGERRLALLSSIQREAEARQAVIADLDHAVQELRRERDAMTAALDELRRLHQERPSGGCQAGRSEELDRLHARIAEREHQLAASESITAETAAAAAAAADESTALRAQLSANQGVLAERAALLGTMDAALKDAHADRVARGEVIGGLRARIAELEGELAQHDSLAADSAAQVAALHERTAMLDAVAAERASLIERLDGLARASGERAAAAEAVRSHLEAATAQRQAQLDEALAQTADLAAGAEAAMTRAQVAERECEARQVVIDELVRARDALAAALGNRRSPSLIDRLLRR